MLMSLAIHAVLVAVVMLLAAQTLLRSAPTKKERELDIVFYRPPEIKPPARPVPPGPGRDKVAAGSPAGEPAPAVKPKPNAPAGPDKAGPPEIPPAPDPVAKAESQPEPKPRAATAGILAFKDKLASLTQDKTASRFGSEARHGAADDVAQPSSRGSMLTAGTSGSSGGINVASLNRSVGGGGGGGGGGGTGSGGAGGNGGMPGVAAGRATSSIASIGGGERPKTRSGAPSSRSDEEIQIVFDRYKATFYRLYNRELRKNPALKGQMVLRLTIEPDGSVSMCALQSSDMNTPDLADQVMSRVRSMNFGAKDGPAVTIVYPIEFLPTG
jgi:hypothetical protein